MSVNTFKEMDGSTDSEVTHNLMEKPEASAVFRPMTVVNLIDSILSSEISGELEDTRMSSDPLDRRIQSLHRDLSTLQSLEIVLGMKKRTAVKRLIALMAELEGVSRQ